MMNYWWITRPKRKLNSIPQILALLSESFLDAEWSGARKNQLNFEKALESAGLKRKGSRRDQRAGGARTYIAWLESLGLLFKHNTSSKTKLTLAGEAILNGESPIEILTNQVLKYQFPSAFSVSKGVGVNKRFQIRPFRFMLKLLLDERLNYLTQEEIAKIIIVEAENESASCYEYIVNKILDFRKTNGNIVTIDNFQIYNSSRTPKVESFSKYLDIANTIKCWLVYTQLVVYQNEKLTILDGRKDKVISLLSNASGFVDRYQEHEYFQRKFGTDPYHKKDTRNLEDSKNITSLVLDEARIKTTFLTLSLEQPILRLNNAIIEQISGSAGVPYSLAESYLYKHYPNGALYGFISNLPDLAFSGTKKAVDFEIATTHLLNDVFNYQAKHIGPLGLTPDIEIFSKECNYTAIIDNKAYKNYSINNDHHNRMVHNYIQTYKDNKDNIVFFLYIAGGFSHKIDEQIKRIVKESNVHGSAINIYNFISLIRVMQDKSLSHSVLKNLFTKDREIHLSDIEVL